MTAVREYGECQISTAGHRLVVDRADPEVLIADELMHQIRTGQHHPDIHYDGDLLTIDGVNRKVIYRVGDAMPHPGNPTVQAWHASWPD
jgi:hypothetical protein